MRRVSTSIEITGDVLRRDPQLPPELKRLDMRIRYPGHSLDLRLTPEALTLQGREHEIAPIRLAFRDEIVEFTGGTRVSILASSGKGSSFKEAR